MKNFQVFHRNYVKICLKDNNTHDGRIYNIDSFETSFNKTHLKQALISKFHMCPDKYECKPD